jgi:dihydrodipicolinate synthase/N-acetylneuraminate lyase
VKAACALLGDTTGPVRAPLLALADDEISELARLLERAGANVVERVRTG